MITTSFESPKIGKETHYLKMGVQGVTKKWTPFVTNSSPFRPFFRDSFEIFDRKGQK